MNSNDPFVCVHELFEAQVERTPDEIAIVSGQQTLTYAELNQRANQLAHYLKRLGVAAESLVGVCVARSPELFVGMLGILKAGGAYLPLDPAYPDERLEFMLEDAGVGVVLTTEDISTPSVTNVSTVIHLDAMGSEISGELTCSPDAAVGPDNLAYVIYTSGSTGQPKGGAMEHHSLVNMLWWHFQDRPASFGVTLQFCPVSFDFSFHEIFSTLCFGGPLVLVTETVRCNPFALAAFIRDHHIEKMFLPVTALQQLAGTAETISPPQSLREVVTTGEQLHITPAIVRFFAESGARLHNHYGATEFQDAATFTLSGDPLNWPTIAPIGYPLSNVQIHILDPVGQPVNRGDIGELYIGGVGVARGYLNRPELTKEAFTNNPFGEGRLYKTGDLARYKADGSIENLGRSDHQVKIRGIRIELGEIEAVLAKHPSVRENAVVAQEGAAAGHKRLVAYIISGEETPSEQELYACVAEQLPEHMLPEAFVFLDDMPLTPSGKTDRQALPVPDTFFRTLSNPAVTPESDTERLLVHIWQDVLNMDVVGTHDNFFDIGATSLLLVQIHQRLSEHFKNLSTVDFFQYPTIHRLAAHLNEQPLPRKVSARKKRNNNECEDIAIIGMSGRFPGAEDLDTFWDNLRSGVESISFFDKEQKGENDDALIRHPDYVNAAAIVPNVDQFDAAFFDMSPKEATTMDPQQKLLLECAWEAFEDAGYNPESYPDPVGVYAGSSMSTYLINNVAPNLGYPDQRPFIEADMLQFQVKQGNDRNYLPTRISYKLNLKGPSVNVQTACSTALVAVHLARQSLLSGECDMALAGGMSVIVPDQGGYLYEEGMIRSSDGHCRAFDADAEGTLFGNGGGLVLLKRLSDAVADHDNIIAVLKSSAINNDGASKVGFTAPSVERQVDVISDALTAGEIEPASVTYIEAHGTATALGDPIEIAALTQAFEQTSQQQLAEQHCAIGSVKTNIGHLDEAAGIASLIKTALALKNKEIPPSLHYQQANPQIDFEKSPFYVNTELAEWKTDGIPRRAGVSSFGMGGTNCHAILEEAPPQKNNLVLWDRDQHLLTLSAQTPAALHALSQRYADYLSTTNAELADICFTANTGRKHFDRRATFVAGSKEQLQTQLEQFVVSTTHGQKNDPHSKIAFLFTGQGSQYVDMGRQLFESQPVFRQTLQQCDAILQPLIHRSLLDILYPEPGQSLPINETAYTQPALFAVEYALYQLWKSWGIEPSVVMGHSVGEYVAACVAGVFTLEDGLRLIAERGRLMQALPTGGEMLAVMASETEVAPYIRPHHEQLSIAAINGPDSVVIAGEGGVLESVIRQLQADGIRSKRLTVSHAFHSPLMEPMLDAFAEVGRTVTYTAPRISLISNLTGRAAGEATDPAAPKINSAEYWVQHVRQPVRFLDGCTSLRQYGIDAFLEMGPRPVLLSMARECLPEYEALWLPSLSPGRDWQQLLNSLSECYLNRLPINWHGFDQGYDRYRTQLPTYPWQRERYWIESEQSRTTPATKQNVPSSEKLHPLLDEIIPLPGSDEVRFQVKLDSEQLSWLKDYKVMQAVALPAAAALDMVFSAARLLMPSTGVSLNRVVMTNSLVPLKDRVTLQLVLKLVNDSVYRFELISLGSESNGLLDWKQSWKKHATGELILNAGMNASLIGLKQLQALCETPLSPELLYQRYYTQQMDYGQRFKRISHLSGHGQEVLSKIELTTAVDESEWEYQIHPTLLDACLQTVYAATLNDTGLKTTDLMLPGQFESMTLHSVSRDPSAQYWCHVRQQRDNKWHVRLMDEDGQLVAEILGYQLQRISKTNLAAEQVSQWFYRIAWEAANGHDTTRNSACNESDHWLVFAGSGLGMTLSEQIKASGKQVTIVSPGAAYAQPADGHYVIDQNDPADYQRIFCDIDTAAYTRIVYLSGATVSGSADAPQFTHELCVGALYIVQALNAMNLTLPVCFVTCGSQSIDDEGVNPAQAALWGMGRTLLWEQSELGCVCIDLDAENTNVAMMASQLVQTLQMPGYETQIAWRGGKAHVARLESYCPGQQDDLACHMTVVEDGCYLLVGGSGGLGLKVAEYLVTQGARHLILSSRHEISDKTTRRAIAALQALGASVTTVVADVSEEAGVRVMLAACAKTGPLHGVVHLAGITDDGMVANQTPERFKQVMAAKVAGAWHLHQLTQEIPLDFFVCFSSDSSLLGYASQTAYSAANAFLDGLAYHRQAQGLPSLTINWGPWGEVGISSRVSDNYQHRMMMHGRYFIPVDLALQALDIAFSQSLPQLAVLPIDWNRWAQTLTLPHPWPFVANVTETLTESESVFSDTSVKSPRTLLEQILLSPVSQRRALLEDHLRVLVGRVLGASTTELGRDQGFFDFGVDSLTSIELRNLLQVDLETKLPQMIAFTYPSIKALSSYLIAEILDIEFDSASADEDRETADTLQNQLADEVNELSDSDAEDELLRELERLELG